MDEITELEYTTDTNTVKKSKTINLLAVGGHLVAGGLQQQRRLGQPVVAHVGGDGEIGRAHV